MTTAACYLRKSTDEGDRSEDAKSITRQLERCQEYARKMGWTLSDEHIFSDDGVSGAAFNKRERPGFYRLLDALDPAPPFQVLIVSELSRLGRDTYRTIAAVQDILDAGVRLFVYLDDKEVTLDTAEDEVKLFMPAWASSQEKRNAGARTRDALRRKASLGYVTGGRCYGYRHVRVSDHTERVIHPEQARVVEQIFTMVAEGAGFRRVGRTLNAQGTKGPRGGEWSTTTIKAIVHNRLYLGESQHGRMVNVRRRGQRLQVPAPVETIISQQRDEWRIISQTAWDAAHRRLAVTRTKWTGYRKTDGTLIGKPETGKHLLSGLVVCACGASMTPIVRMDKRARAHRWYGCSRWFKRSQLGCQSRRLIGYDLLNDAVLSTFSPEHVAQVLLEETFTEPIGEWALSYAEGREHAEREVERTQGELAHLTSAIRLGGDLKVLVQALREAEHAHDAALARLDAIQDDDPDAEPSAADLAQLEAEQRELDATLQPLTLTTADPAIARAILRRLLDGPVTVMPVVDTAGNITGWELRLSGDLSRLIPLPELTKPVGEAWITRWVGRAHPRDFAH